MKIYDITTWPDWLLLGGIILVIIILLGSTIRRYRDFHLRRMSRMRRRKVCWNCHMEVIGIRENSPCPNCSQGFIIEIWDFGG